MNRSLLSGLLLSQIGLFAVEPAGYEFKVLATSKTSTMEKEMNNAAEAGTRSKASWEARQRSAAKK